MLRFLLSLLALVSGLAVPGTVAARDLGPSETEIGALAEAIAAPAGETARIALIPARPLPAPARRLLIIRPGLAFALPAPTVFIGSDRARC